jgi:hypothetical protein
MLRNFHELNVFLVIIQRPKTLILETIEVNTRDIESCEEPSC